MICFECGKPIVGEQVDRNCGGNPVHLHPRRCAKAFDRAARPTTRAVTTGDGHLANQHGNPILNRPGDSESFDG